MSVIWWWSSALDRQVVFVDDVQTAIEAISSYADMSTLLDWLRSDKPVYVSGTRLYVRCREGVE